MARHDHGPEPWSRGGNRPRSLAATKTSKNQQVFLAHDFLQTIVETGRRGDGGGDMAGYSPDRFAAEVSRRSGNSLATGAGVSGHSRSGSSHRCKLRAQQRTQSTGAPRPPSAWTEHRPTVIIHSPVFSSKPKRNVACVQRLKTLFCWGLPPLSGRNMPATTSDTPTGCPAWNQQMRAPELPNSRLWNRILVGPPLCGPPHRIPNVAQNTTLSVECSRLGIYL